MEENKPYIPASKKLPEITIKAVILGALLSVALSAANTYLGLFAGMTVSASIPAAVISMAALKLFRKNNILENNIVQTSASAGESLAAGVIFTFPALVLMGYWDEFNYWETALISLCGGVLGVLFTIPLRSALIVKQKLKFPEGVATSEVLKSGEEGGKAIKYLAFGAIIGGLAKLSTLGFKIWEEVLEKSTLLSKKAFLYFGINLSPALVAVGYIVGIKVAILIFAGGVISWWIGVPTVIGIVGTDNLIQEFIASGAITKPADQVSSMDLGKAIFATKIRYLGVGAMLVGGLWTLISLRKTIGDSLRQGVAAFKSSNKSEEVPRTEMDTPFKWVIMGIGIMIVPVFAIYVREIEQVTVTAFMAIVMVFAGFLFAAVAGYMAGLVGSSNNPISGVTIATVLTSSLTLLALLGSDAQKGPAAAILIGSVVACAAAIAGDNMQDLKAGNILGATPRNQQIMQMIGVVSAAFILPLVLELLNTAFGFGVPTEDRPKALTAPQAFLMQSVAQGVFSGDLPWTFVTIGGILGIVVIILDKIQEKRGADFRIPVLAVAIGIYLPFQLDSAIMLGGVIAWLVSRYQKSKRANADNATHQASLQRSNRTGLLFASGLITGEALLGILIAIPIAYSEDVNVLALLKDPLGTGPGILVLGALCFWLYRLAARAYVNKD
ncbi:MAG: oligopeptide transporter, OPT family [Bacteroidota bacterium]